MDAFGTAHRAQASTHGVAKFAPVACAGPLLEKELRALEQALSEPARPMVAIVGGSKVSTKLTVLETLSDKVDQLVVGGGIANTFLAASGKPVGKSLCEQDLVPAAQALMQKTGIPIPTDVVTGKEFSESAEATLKRADEVAEDDMIFDIGPESADAIAEMELDYVVVTSVDRDDLPDQGSGHFAACIEQIRVHAPGTMVEVLVPDFSGDVDLMRKVVVARPDVLAHNVECIERLTPTVRDPRAGYRQSLDMLAAIKRLAPDMHTKSSLMVGIGETEPEMLQAMQDLRDVGCDFLTIGQYLQPTKMHLDVVEFVHPDTFAMYKEVGLSKGFAFVESSPLVRSSYHAERHL